MIVYIYLQCPRTVFFRNKPVGNPRVSPVYPSDMLLRDVTTVTSDPWTKYLSLETSTVLAGYSLAYPTQVYLFFFFLTNHSIYSISPDFLELKWVKQIPFSFSVCSSNGLFKVVRQSGFITLKKDGLTAFWNQYAGAVCWIKANIRVQSRKCPIWPCPFLVCVRSKRNF